MIQFTRYQMNRLPFKGFDIRGFGTLRAAFGGGIYGASRERFLKFPYRVSRAIYLTYESD